MKTFAFLILILPIFAFGQLKEAVINLPNKSAKEMYSTAKEWFALSSYPGNITIQVDDPEEQKIIRKGIKNINYTLQKSQTFIDVTYTLSVHFKDGRYKYLLTINTIKFEDGYEMSFEEFKSLTTEEGWNAYRKDKDIKPQFSNKVDETTINDIYSLMNINLDSIITGLTTQLNSEKQDINW